MNKVQEIRLLRGLTQEELANRVGITRGYLSEIEGNKRNPGTTVALRIAKILNTKVERIFFDNT